MKSLYGQKKLYVTIILVAVCAFIGFAIFKKILFQSNVAGIDVGSQVSPRNDITGQIGPTDAIKTSLQGASAKSGNSQRPPTLANTGSALPVSSGPLATIRYGKRFHSYAEALAAIANDPTLSEGERATARAQILLTCAAITRKGVWHLPYINATSPDADTRHKAFEVAEKISRQDRCAGISSADYSEKGIRDQWQTAEKLGDARARAAMIDYNLRSSENVAQQINRKDGKPVLIYKGPTEAETQALLAGLNSRDPIFILTHGTLFSETFANVDFVFGSQGEKLDADNFQTFWALVACQFGTECGSANREVMGHCVETGQCAYQSYEEFLLATRVSASQWEQYQRLVPAIVNAINSGDWTNAITRRSPPSGLDPTFYNQTPFNSRTLKLPG